MPILPCSCRHIGQDNLHGPRGPSGTHNKQGDDDMTRTDTQATVNWQDLYVVDIHTEGSYAATAITLGDLVRRAEAGDDKALDCLCNATFYAAAITEWDGSFLVEAVWPDEDPRWDDAHDAPSVPVDWRGLRMRVAKARGRYAR